MVVNNALKEIPPSASGPPINYVMNQAAISSEAFQSNYDPVGPVAQTIRGVRELVAHAQTLGFPDPEEGRIDPDVQWGQQEEQVEADRKMHSCPVTAPFTLPPPPAICLDGIAPLPECSLTRCARVTRYYGGQSAMNPELGIPQMPAQTAFFATRWKKFTRNQDQSLPGAWTRLFAGNTPTQPRPELRVFSTYSSDDSVLRIDRGRATNPFEIVNIMASGAKTGAFKLHAWLIAQTVFKPSGSVPENIENLLTVAEATDTIDQQKWWTLAAEGRPSPWRSTSEPSIVFDQETIWGNSHPRDGASRHRRTREWAELALWFPELSPPAGVTTLEHLTQPVYTLSGVNLYDLEAQGRNIDFGKISGELGLVADGNESHSYMAIRRFPLVWKGFRVIKDLFKQ
jgi:hypothetical protein